MTDSCCSQLAVPAFNIVEHAEEACWRLFIQDVNHMLLGKPFHFPVLKPREPADVCSIRGCTLLGLLCSHDEGRESSRRTSWYDDEATVDDHLAALRVRAVPCLALLKASADVHQVDHGGATR